MKTLIVVATLLAAASLRRHFTGSFVMQIGPVDGKYVLYHDERIYREDRLHTWGLDAPGRASGTIRVRARLANNGQGVEQAFKMLGPDLGSLILTQGQVRELINSGSLRTKPGRTFAAGQKAMMLITPGDEPVQADLLNVYVLCVSRSPNGTIVVFPRKLRCCSNDDISGVACEPADGEELSRLYQVVGRIR